MRGGDGRFVPYVASKHYRGARNPKPRYEVINPRYDYVESSGLSTSVSTDQYDTTNGLAHASPAHTGCVSILLVFSEADALQYATHLGLELEISCIDSPLGELC
jgi:hypothetical protein